MHPLPPINGLRVKRPNALSAQYIPAIQILAQVEDLHCAAVRAIHLEFGDQSPAACSQLSCLASALDLRPQRKQFVHALFGLQGARGLSLADVSTEVAIRHHLRALRRSSGFFSDSSSSRYIVSSCNVLHVSCR